MENAYDKLISLLDQHGVQFRLIDHEPEGRTEVVSAMRGNELCQAAKCMVVMVRLGKKVTRYLLCVIPGNAGIDLDKIKALMTATYVSFASPHIAELLAGSVSGTILPFSFSAELEVIVDPSLLYNEEIYFNAARLDRSMVIKASDYLELCRPRLEKIV